MSSFVKPKIDTTLYLWSEDAKKVLKEVLKEDPITKYPRQPLTGYNDVYTDGTVVSLAKSNDNTGLESWRLFDNNLNTRWAIWSSYNGTTGIAINTS